MLELYLMSDYFMFCKGINLVLKNQENLLKFISKNSDCLVFRKSHIICGVYSKNYIRNLVLFPECIKFAMSK